MSKKMRILVLGATSSIGLSIVKTFSKGNQLILASSKYEKLKKIEQEFLNLDSENIKFIEIDLSLPINSKEIFKNFLCPDIIINAACASSKIKDSNIDPSNYKKITSIDLYSPISILDYFIQEKINLSETTKLNYIFINTILTKIKSPDYSIYTSYKLLHQNYIKSFNVKYGDYFNFINVIVGTQIDRNKESKNSINLAERIKVALKKNEKEFIFGLKGKIIYMVYNISPVLSNFFIFFKRFIFKIKSFLRFKFYI